MLTITLLQTELHWEQPAANRNSIEEELRQLSTLTDLLILPEMFSTGFSMNASSVAESMNGPTHQWMQQLAARKECAIMGSLIIRDEGHFYNRLLFVHPDGRTEHYDKRHCFTLAGEHEVYTPGTHQLVVELKGWRICPMICYDLRFPVWSRNTQNYDLLIYVANWPDKRREAWKALLRARAIENLSYTVGVNRVGTDEKGHHYSGDSSVYDYSGKKLYHSADLSDLHTLSLHRDEQEQFRQRFGFLNDRDRFELLP